MLTRVKICGLCRPRDASLAAECGADYLGVILAPGGPRTRTEREADAIWAAAPGVPRVGVFVDPDPTEAIPTAERLGLSVIQLHGSESPALVTRIRAAGAWRVWKAIRPRTEAEFVESSSLWAGRVDGLLVDGFSQTAKGGTGTRFPWDVVERNRQAVPCGAEFVVAGGLGPENVAQAIARLAPDTVDVSSGVESAKGIKSAELLRAFMAAVRGARAGIEEAGTHG